MKRPGPIRVCAECGREREHEAHGLCRTCYTRWRRRAALAAGRVPRIAARVQDYAEVRSLGETRETACARLLRGAAALRVAAARVGGVAA